MKHQDEIYRAMEGIIKEIEAYGKFRERKGSEVYDRATSIMAKFRIIIQSSRSISHYWYPGKNYAKARLAGPVDFIRSRSMSFHFLPSLKWKNPVFLAVIWLLLGMSLGAILTWIVFCA